jgi:hypothetical protein
MHRVKMPAQSTEKSVGCREKKNQRKKKGWRLVYAPSENACTKLDKVIRVKKNQKKKAGAESMHRAKMPAQSSEKSLQVSFCPLVGLF